MFVSSAPGQIVYVCGEDIERVRCEIQNVFSGYGLDIRIKNLVLSQGIPYVSWLARLRKIFVDSQSGVVQKEAECELIATAQEKLPDGNQLELKYAIVPAHLLQSGIDETNQPPVSINFVEPASQQFIYTFVEDETQPCKLQATPLVKYRITTEIQSDEQSHSHMNDIAFLKFEQNPKQALNAAVEPLPIPNQSYINFLARRQSVVMVGGHVGRIVPSPNVMGNGCLVLGLHLAFVIPSSGSNPMQRFEEGDCGKILHIQYKEGHWMPIAMLVGKYTVEIPEYGSSIYIAIILSEALNEIDRDFGDIYSDIQLHPTSSLYSGEGTELTSEEKLSISSAAELRYNKKRFASFTNLKELKIEDTRLDSSDFKALEKLTSLERLRLRRCKFPRISFDSLTKLKELEISRNKLNSSSLVGMEKLKSLEKLDLHSCGLPELPYSFDSLTNLKELDISSNDLDSDSLVGMGKLVLLEKLDLSSCHLNKLPFSFDSLTNLKELDISRNKLDSDSLVDMEKLVLLEKLNLSYCFLKKFQIRFASLTSLRELNISWNKLRSDLLVGMEKLVSLEKLSLSSCDLKKLPFKLSSLTKLRNLDLCDNPLDPDTLDEIVKLESLEYLDLSRCQLIKLPSSFEMLKNLKQLLLLGNNFEEYPSALKSLPSLHTCIYVTFFDLLKKHPTGDDLCPEDMVRHDSLKYQFQKLSFGTSMEPPSRESISTLPRSSRLHETVLAKKHTPTEGQHSRKPVTTSSELPIGKAELIEKPTSTREQMYEEEEVPTNPADEEMKG
ncbi:uncharacterized protein [Watersipora subatra]|uniref:uncharacterized protein n=1 Tax=Watersipora subatra TaxID=2589382 RepID=UPI00355BB4C6